MLSNTEDLALTYSNLVGATSGNIKPRPGRLAKVVVNTAVAGGTITLYDNTAASGSAKIGTITFPGTLLDSTYSIPYDVLFKTGLSAITTGSGLDVTLVYQ